MKSKDLQDLLTSLDITASILAIWAYCPALALALAVVIAYYLY